MRMHVNHAGAYKPWTRERGSKQEITITWVTPGSAYPLGITGMSKCLTVRHL
jgi:hypothetical protein